MNKERWTYKKLGDVAIIINGRNQKAVEDSNGQYPICGSGGIMGYATDYLCPENSVIVGRKGNINHPIFMTQKFWNVDTAFGISANIDYMLPKFLFYFCQIFDFQKLNKAVTIPSLVKSDLLKIDIPVPSKEIQLRIVSELDTINESISLLQEQINDLDFLLQSLFYSNFGDPVENSMHWPVKSMEEVAPCVAFKGIVEPKSGKYWLLNLDMVESQTGRILDKIFCDASEIGNSTNVFSEENVLYSKLRPYLNKVVLPDEKGYCTSELLPLLPQKDCLDRVFLALLLRSNSFVNYINNRVAGAKMPRVSMNDFRSFNVILPPLSIQQSFASKVATIEEAKANVNTQIAELQTLLASRIQYWFD